MMKWFSVFALLAIASLAPATTSAQALDEPESRRLTVAGVDGVWMPMATFRAVTADLDAAAGQREQLGLLTEALTLERAQVADIQLSLAAAETEATMLAGSLAEALEEASRARERVTRARRRLGWSFAGGAVVAVALTALVTGLAAR